MQPTSWWAPGHAVGSVSASVAGVVSGTVQMSCAWRNHDPSSGSWQRTLKSLSWEQHCLWAWTGGWQERSSLISACPSIPSSSCAWLSSEYHPPAHHHRAQNFSRPLRALPLPMHRKGKKRQEQEGHGLGDTRGIGGPLGTFLSLSPTSLCVRHMHTYKHRTTPCLRRGRGCRPGEGTAESF